MITSCCHPLRLRGRSYASSHNLEYDHNDLLTTCTFEVFIIRNTSIKNNAIVLSKDTIIDPGCSETRFLGSRPRPRLCFFESQWRDETETFFLLSLNIETRPRLFFSESQCRDETETFFLLSLNVETRPRLFFSESQYRDETETLFLLRIDHFVVIQFEIDHIYS